MADEPFSVRDKCLQDEDVQINDTPCPTCGAHDTLCRTCWQCGGEGYFDAYEDDPLWYQPGDVEGCSTCKGTGGMHWCSECGHDFTFNIPGEVKPSSADGMPPIQGGTDGRL